MTGYLLREVAAGVQTVHVSLPPPGQHVRDLLAHHAAEGADDLQHRGARPRAQVELVHAAPAGGHNGFGTLYTATHTTYTVCEKTWKTSFNILQSP